MLKYLPVVDTSAICPQSPVLDWKLIFFVIYEIFGTRLLSGRTNGTLIDIILEYMGIVHVVVIVV